ncbi:MAG: hypothetical protein HY951_10460 [Bacteroidia bacterium]|nr:hypothetical protein [Bacteroidia bacterium]
MRRGLFLLLFVVFLINVVEAQSIRQLVHRGNKAFNSENFEAAVFFYNKAIQVSETPLLAWKLAESARMNRDYQLADKWYHFVAEREIKKYPLATFWMGTVEKSMGSYQKAQLNFRKYFNANIKTKDYFTEKARHEITSCENALFLTFDPVDTPFNRMDSTYNSAYSEFQIADFGDTLKYISALRPESTSDSLNYFSRIKSYIIKDSTQNILLLDTNINIPNKNISSFTFIPKSNKIIFAACDRKPGKYKCQLYQSEKLANQWLQPTILSKTINAEGYSTTNPCFANTHQGSYLIFASDRTGSIGKLDLWYSKIDSLGTFNEPVNFGKNINSIDDECTPFYDDKTQTLFFASEWFDNLGGTDIFSVQGNLVQMKYPQNIGFPLNSSSYDVFYNISSDRSNAYFSSNRTLDKAASTAGCCNDLFQITLPKPKIDSVPDVKLETKLMQKSVELIPISLFFHNDEPNPKTWDTTTNINYATSAENYLLLKNNYLDTWSQNLKDEAKDKAMVEIEGFFIDSVEKNFNKLIKFSQLMEQLLSIGQNIEITIKGFASPLNSNAYNINLSKRRIQSLVNFFNEYKDGVFVQYINGTNSNGAKLNIKREAFGEEMVVTGVSDNLNDVRNSVYSPSAACERKIAVIAVSFTK